MQSRPPSPSLRSFAPLFAVVVLGCGSSGNGAAEKPAASAEYLGLATPTDGFQVRDVGTTIAPGADEEFCEVAELPGTPDQKYYVHSVELGNGKLSHHLIVSAATPGGPAETELRAMNIGDRVPCVGAQIQFGEAGLENLAGSQQPYLDTTYPDGIGRLYYGGQRIVFDYHFLNTSKEPIEARSAFNLHLTDEAHVQHLAGGIGFYNWTIDTPPGKQGAFTAECHFGSAVMTGGLTRHTHRWGTDYSVWYAGGPNDGEHLWTSHDWENDTSFPFDPPVAMNAGEGFKFECDYTNTEDYDLRFGTKASDEMCILFGLVWDPDAFAAPSEGCDVTWVDSNGVGHPATDDGGFPAPPAADASLCLGAATASGGTASACLTCECDSCASVLIKCKTDAECGPIISCYQGGAGACEPVIDAHSSGVGLAKQVSACISSKCSSVCPLGVSSDAGAP